LTVPISFSGRDFNRRDFISQSEYFPRIAEVHLKDTYARYRGNTSTPSQEQHRAASVYRNLGGGGVDMHNINYLRVILGIRLPPHN
jgi:hypothetical protein